MKSAAHTVLREDAKYLRSFHDEAKWWPIADRIDALVVEHERYEKALRQIGLPMSVPPHFEPLDWWRHMASRRAEIARDALAVSVEELILGAD